MADDTTGQPAGNRRIDRVLSADYLKGLSARSLEEVRAMRADAEQEEVDLSYLRRLLQGRVDILRAELARRAGTSTSSLVEDLPKILADDGRGGARGMGRHAALEPSRADAHRRYVETLVADVELSDVAALPVEELERALGLFEREERDVSDQRRRVQQVMDACTAEIARRYRDGEADVSQLLRERS